MKRTLAGILAVGALLLAAIRVIAGGYLPYDDALRHAAQAISGRPWSEILVLRPEMQLDSNPGWHWLLGVLHRGLGLGANDLLILSILLLFVAFSLAPLLLLRRPEAWLLALLVANVVDPAWFVRLLSGRPFLVSSAIVPIVLLLWRRLEPPVSRGVLVLFTLCGVLASWVHGAYYLLALPVLALAASGRSLAALRLGGCFVTGIAAGALLTGHPIGHLWQMLLHGYLSVGVPHVSDALATEFRPFDGRMGTVLLFVGLLVWRRSRRGESAEAWWRDPAVVMVLIGWCLGYVTARFWVDWGEPAFLVFVALEIEELLDQGAGRRADLLAPALASVLVVVAISANVQSRWTLAPNRPFLSAQNPDLAPWLPEPGGVVYNTEMETFYSIFFKNPDARWKYILGFEPAMMPPEDYAVYQRDPAIAGRDCSVPSVAKKAAAAGPAHPPASLELAPSDTRTRLVRAGSQHLVGPPAARRRAPPAAAGEGGP